MSLKERGDSAGSEGCPITTMVTSCHRLPNPWNSTHNSVSAERFARSPASSARSRLWETSLGNKAATGQHWIPGQDTKPPEPVLEAPQYPTSKLSIPRARMENRNELSAGETKAGEAWGPSNSIHALPPLLQTQDPALSPLPVGPARPSHTTEGRLHPPPHRGQLLPLGRPLNVPET